MLTASHFYWQKLDSSPLLLSIINAVVQEIYFQSEAMPPHLASGRASFFMLLKNILFPILLRKHEVKCWLRMSHFSTILYALNITCYVLTYSASDAFNTLILWWISIVSIMWSEAKQPFERWAARSARQQVVVLRMSSLNVNLRDFFFLWTEEVLRIRPLRLNVAEKKHGGRWPRAYRT